MMARRSGTGRTFLFLQGPHGPFFGSLARAMATAGARCLRAGFTAGDRAFWPRALPYIAHREGLDAWAQRLPGILADEGVTDVVLYGDTRPLHRAALDMVRARGITAHVFEEGYLRPWWVSYERGGSNANSPLMDLPNAAFATVAPDAPVEAPDHWGDLRQHVFWGAAYHAVVALGGRAYPGYRPHRAIGLGAEAGLWLRQILRWPVTAVTRWQRTRAIRRSARPWHLCLMQLDHDASYRAALPFPDTAAFVAHVIGGFAAGAPAHHLLVFKQHPLDDGRLPLARIVAEAARAAGIADRVRTIPGGQLARVLDGATSGVTVSSTAAQAALFRGLPVRAFGRTVYSRPGLTSDQGIAAFFAAPQAPDPAAYAAFRAFLLGTSQLPGGFYSARGRRQLIRRLPDMMLAPDDPYARATSGLQGAAQRQHLASVGSAPAAR
jgi:capsular polysaccharide export protein